MVPLVGNKLHYHTEVSRIVETGIAEDRGCFLSATENHVFSVMTSSPKLLFSAPLKSKGYDKELSVRANSNELSFFERSNLGNCIISELMPTS